MHFKPRKGKRTKTFVRYIINNNQHVGSGKPVSIVDPEFLKDRTKDDDAVEAVEGRLEVGHDSKSIHTHPCMQQTQ